jgi:hypothetical protein
VDTQGTGGSRVEIRSIPWQFSARGYELLDQLFVPLLSTAQLANDLMGVRARGESSAEQAATFMAGELLRDVSFIPVRAREEGAFHLYQLDFGADTFEVKTSVFSGQTNKEALFRVKVQGRIRGDKFQVLDSTTGAALFSFTRFEAEKRDFFVREFPFLAHESRKDPELFEHGGDVLARETIDLVLGIPLSRELVTVRVEKLAGSLEAEVKSPTSDAAIMKLSLSALNNISKAVKIIAEYLAANPSARKLVDSSSVVPQTETVVPQQKNGEVKPG